jgi:hypothetical protein
MRSLKRTHYYLKGTHFSLTAGLVDETRARSRSGFSSINEQKSNASINDLNPKPQQAFLT